MPHDALNASHFGVRRNEAVALGDARTALDEVQITPLGRSL